MEGKVGYTGGIFPSKHCNIWVWAKYFWVWALSLLAGRVPWQPPEEEFHVQQWWHKNFPRKWRNEISVTAMQEQPQTFLKAHPKGFGKPKLSSPAPSPSDTHSFFPSPGTWGSSNPMWTFWGDCKAAEEQEQLNPKVLLCSLPCPSHWGRRQQQNSEFLGFLSSFDFLL